MVVDMFWVSLLADIIPGVTLSLVAVASAALACMTLRRGKTGRARSAVAYVGGFLAGAMVSSTAATALGPLTRDATPILAAGLLGAFFGPFVGMLRAKWLGPARRERRRASLREVSA